MKKKVAIVYDRVNKWGGAEKVLLALHEVFPDAPLYTSVYDKKKAPWAKVFPKVYTSFLQKISYLRDKHEKVPFLMPFAFSNFDFNVYDLVISVTSEFAKGIKVRGKTRHICYCLTPTRYLWSGYEDYFGNPFFRFLATPAVSLLKFWDKRISQKPDEIIAISTEVQRRIKKYYGRKSEIIFPPVDTHRKKLSHHKSYYLIVSRLVPYKRVDLAIKVFNKLGYPLYIVGSGTEIGRLKKIAKGNIKFFGEVSEKKLYQLYSGAKALIMPQEEDFGIVAVEAQSLGVPVIAFKKGGAADTVINGRTGILFESQTEASLKGAIAKFVKMVFNHRYLKSNAKKFSKESFKKKFGRLI